VPGERPERPSSRHQPPIHGPIVAPHSSAPAQLRAHTVPGPHSSGPQLRATAPGPHSSAPTQGRAHTVPGPRSSGPQLRARTVPGPHSSGPTQLRPTAPAHSSAPAQRRAHSSGPTAPGPQFRAHTASRPHGSGSGGRRRRTGRTCPRSPTQAGRPRRAIVSKVHIVDISQSSGVCRRCRP
jgi:hypothetical protein